MVKIKEHNTNYRKGAEYIVSLYYFTYLLTYKNINLHTLHYILLKNIFLVYAVLTLLVISISKHTLIK